MKPREQINWSFGHLPWAPKVTPKEMNEYISAARLKYLDYSLEHDTECEETLKIINQNRFGLPEPIQKSLSVMDKHIYISLAERQRNQWRKTKNHPFTQAYKPKQTPIEAFYKIIHKKISVYVVALLKLLLSAAPTSNKGEILQHDQSQQNVQVVQDPKSFRIGFILHGSDWVTF